MLPKDVTTIEHAKSIIQNRELEDINVSVVDIDGVLRGKRMARTKFLSALEKGFGFCDVVLGWDVNDVLYDNVSFTGWHSGYPDAPVQIAPNTCRQAPFEEKGLLFLGQFTEQAAEICPRQTLQRVLHQAEQAGFLVKAAFEYEFFVFEEHPIDLKNKKYRDLQPISPGGFGYSALRASTHTEFHQELLQLCRRIDCPLEGLHTETGPGVLEAAITVADGLKAADDAVLFKTFTKAFCQRLDRMATFMARWSTEVPGSSGHLHISLTDIKGQPLFHDPNQAHNMNKTMQYFLGGLQRYLPEFLCMLAPTVNSFTRLVPGFWAPTQATWGVENRTCAIRAIPGHQNAQRIEVRAGGADGNPHLVLAASLAAGLLGLEQQLQPTQPIEGNAYAVDMEPEYHFPISLQQAADKFSLSSAARKMLGDAFVDHYAATREWEYREATKQVTDWQLERYFEII